MFSIPTSGHLRHLRRLATGFFFFTLTASFSHAAAIPYPRPLSLYADSGDGVIRILEDRAAAEPFNLIATALFIIAILHTFLAPKLNRFAQNVSPSRPGLRRWLHLFGEVELVFAWWAIFLISLLILAKGWGTATHYIVDDIDFTEPLFVVVIMALASTRPILALAEKILQLFARLGRESIGAWWLSVLIGAPLLGSFITEPGAMTIGALILAKIFYPLQPSPRLAYGTLGLLFVNVSIGGTLTHFAAPPIVMVSHAWGWNSAFLFLHFGWKAILGITLSTALYYIFFQRDFAAILQRERRTAHLLFKRPELTPLAPFWVTFLNLGFIVWTIVTGHRAFLFMGGFILFLGSFYLTRKYQTRLSLRAPVLVGIFLAGLVIHGGLQAWWIQPLLGSLQRGSLFIGATLLTAFNDNAAITYLATLVPNFSEPLKYAVVAGAVTGGGLTVIANAPNPAGQSILQTYFPNGISPLKLFAAAIIPTLISGLCFWL